MIVVNLLKNPIAKKVYFFNFLKIHEKFKKMILNRKLYYFYNLTYYTQ